jgi:hypothetical protein
MEESWNEDRVRRTHEISSEKPQRQDDQHEEKQDDGGVGDPCVRYRKNNRLKEVRNEEAEEGGEFLEKETSEEKFFLETV